jgi:hypothetical protein
MKKTTIHLAISALIALATLGTTSVRANAEDASNDINKANDETNVTMVSDVLVMNVEIGKEGQSRAEIRELVRAQASASEKRARAMAINAPTREEVDAIMSNAISTAFASVDGVSMSFGNRTIKNAPYSAEIINERTQMLLDGNQIVKRTTQAVTRDSAGRTRTESRNENGETRNVTIFDPLDGARYILSPQARTATKLKIDPDLNKRIAELREKAKTMAKEGKTELIEREPGKEIVISNVHTQRAGGDKGFREEIRVSVMTAAPDATVTKFPSGQMEIRGGTGNSVGFAPLGIGLAELGPLSNSFRDRQWSKDATTRDLGTKTFDGVRAEGKLRSYTIPAGAIGNRNPITVSTETWYSPELQVTVYSKHADPRSEEVVYRLSNIKRSEPSISLFTVPDGYKISESENISITTKTK